MAADPDGGTTEKHPRKRVRGLLKTLQDQVDTDRVNVTCMHALQIVYLVIQ